MNPQFQILNNIYFKDKKNGFFVDIGANDGVNVSTSLYLEKFLNWRGVCIEPIPEIFNILKHNRSCECLNIALTAKEGIYDFLYVKSNRKPNIYIDMLSGILEYYNPKHLNRIDAEIEKENGKKEIIKVIGKNFNDVIKETEIDFISIDVEGGEYEILSTINFDRYNIKSFTIENNYKDNKNINFITAKGYKHLGEFYGDDIFIKNEYLK